MNLGYHSKMVIRKLKTDGIKTPELYIRWIKAQNKISNNTEKFESSMVRWYGNRSIKSPEDLLASYGDSGDWVDLGINADSVKDWKNLGIKSPSEAEKWIKLGVKNSSSVSKLMNNGFTPVTYEPYKDIEIAKAIKLKEWNVQPNKLVISISKTKYTNYFDNKDNFMKIYTPLNGKCNEITNSYIWKEYSQKNNLKGECYTIKYNDSQVISKNQTLVINKDRKRIRQHNISQDEYLKMTSFELAEAAKEDQKNNFESLNSCMLIKHNEKTTPKKYGTAIIRILDGYFETKSGTKTFIAPVAEILYVK